MNENKLLAKNFIEDLKGTKPVPPLNNYSLYVFGSGYNTEKYYGSVYKHQSKYNFLNIRCNGHTQAFLPEQTWRDYATEVFINYLKDISYIDTVKNNFYKNFPAIDSLYDTYTYEFISNRKEEDLLPIIEKTFDLFWETNAWSHFSIYFDIDLCYRLVKSVHSNFNREDIDSIWHKATEMVAESFDKAQKRDILQRLANNENNIVEHCQYFYTSYKNVINLEKVQEELTKTYGEFLNNPELAKQELARMDAEYDEKKKEYELWKITLTSVQQQISDFCQTVMQVRDQRKNHFSKGITLTWRIAEKLFDMVHINKQLIENVLPFEELLKGSAYIESIQNELEKRNNGYVVYVPYSGPKEISYENLQEEYDLINNYFISEDQKKAEEIKGQIGNKGIITGIVKIIRSLDQFNEFKEDEILVTGMTRPEFVPLMRKAKAIITDEGGITCHAAIVSRELKIPCIIGTKFATQILKDGDVVEVDANKGIVTKIS
jgi:phosphohistidine swiveling domain-containing protein